MKRIIARLGANNDDRESSFNYLIGRQFIVGERSVVVEDVIAEGGFGVVFRVRDFSNNSFALKRLCVNCEEDLKRCKQEIIVLKSIHHKNIIRLVDAGVIQNHNGVYEVLMLLQYCRDTVTGLIEQSLSTRISLKEQTVLRIFCDMCEAVGCLHEQNIIHRDLKLENILIDECGNYVLCDFGSATTRMIKPRVTGISKVEEEISKYTTLAYRAPEMVDLYSDKEISTKADVWAMGCLLYTLCFLKLPFKDSTLAIQAGEYSVPDDSDYGPNILKLIGYMLQVDPSRRPDIYQVSALAFQMTASYVTPLRNLNNASVPKFDDLPMPTRDSDVKIKTSTQTSVSSSASSNEPIKTSVVPRQRPRVCGTTSLSLNNLPPPEGQSRGRSVDHRADGDGHPATAPPLGATAVRLSGNPISSENGSSKQLSDPAGGDAGRTDDSISPEIEQSLLINLSADESLNQSGADRPSSGSCDTQTNNFMKPVDSAGVNSTSLIDLFGVDTSSSTPVASTKPQAGCFPQSSTSAVIEPGMRPRNGGPLNSRAGHRRLMSDTSAIPGSSQGASGNYLRPPTRISHMPQWGPPRFGFPNVQQPLTASVSMDYIRFAGAMQQQASYQLPPRALNQQPQQLSHGPVNYQQASAAPVGSQNYSIRPHKVDYQNPHHQWKHPLRGNRPLSSSSADLINPSGGGSHVNEKQSSLEPPVNQLAKGSLPMSSGLRNNRATSAMELDAFGSVPFSAMLCISAPK